MSIDWDKPIETVSGLPAKVISTDHRYRGKILVIVQIEHISHSCIGYYTHDSIPTYGSPEIRNCKTKHEGWVNVYPALLQEGKAVITKIYESEEVAKDIASSDVIATVKIEWEE